MRGRFETAAAWWHQRMPSLFNLIVLTFVFAPLIVVIGVSFNEGEFTSFPPQGLSLDWYRSVMSDPAFRDSFFLSARIALLTVLVATPIGLVSAIAITRLRGGMVPLLQFLALGPLVLPEVLLGLGLLALIIAQLSVRMSEWVLVAGHVLVTLPFAVNLISSTLSQQDRNIEAAARTLGASPLQTFRYAVLPAIKGSLAAAALFVFIFSFDNIAISLFLSVPGMVTLPVRMFQYVTYRYDPTVAAASTVLIVISVVLFMIARRLVNLEEVFGDRRRRSTDVE